ncbi:MAG: FMN-binding protein [Clostridia bacterium]|nr:FMN-binding protein [Clostridia bacterium]
MNETKKAPNQIVRLTFILFIISAVIALVLGLTNMMTKDRIAEQSLGAAAEAYTAVLAADSYSSVDFSADDYPTVNAVYQAGDVGYVVELTFSGAMGNITAAVGIDTAGAVTGVEIIDSAETSGLGARASEPEFKDQYIGATSHVGLVANGGAIEVISGATITSDAVTEAVNTAMDVVASLG